MAKNPVRSGVSSKILNDKGEDRPPLVLLENVVGFLQSNGGKDLETALLALNGAWVYGSMR